MKHTEIRHLALGVERLAAWRDGEVVILVGDDERHREIQVTKDLAIAQRALDAKPGAVDGSRLGQIGRVRRVSRRVDQNVMLLIVIPLHVSREGRAIASTAR